MPGHGINGIDCAREFKLIGEVAGYFLMFFEMHYAHDANGCGWRSRTLIETFQTDLNIEIFGSATLLKSDARSD